MKWVVSEYRLYCLKRVTPAVETWPGGFCAGRWYRSGRQEKRDQSSHSYLQIMVLYMMIISMCIIFSVFHLTHPPPGEVWSCPPSSRTGQRKENRPSEPRLCKPGGSTQDRGNLRRVILIIRVTLGKHWTFTFTLLESRGISARSPWCPTLWRGPRSASTHCTDPLTARLWLYHRSTGGGGNNLARKMVRNG